MLRRFAPLLIPLSVFVVAAWWLRPLNDDFCMMQLRDQRGLWQGWIMEYNTWIGRYSATALQLLFNGYAPLVPLLLAGAWLAALTVLLKRALYTIEMAIWCAVLIVLALLALAPNLFESYLWLQGSTTYLAALLAYTLCLLFPLPPVAFLAAGFSDVGALLGTLTLFGLYLVTGSRRWLYAAAGSALGLALVILAPGNAVRQSSVPSPNFGGALSFSLLTLGEFFKYRSTWLILIAVAVLFVVVGSLQSRRVAPRYFAVLPIVMLLGVWIGWFVSLYLTSNVLAARAWVILQYFAVGCAAVWGYWLGVAGQWRGRWLWAMAVLCITVVVLPAAANSSLALTYTYDYATIFDSGHLLTEIHEDWIERCAVPYYTVR